MVVGSFPIEPTSCPCGGNGMIAHFAMVCHCDIQCHQKYTKKTGVRWKVIENSVLNFHWMCYNMLYRIKYAMLVMMV